MTSNASSLALAVALGLVLPLVPAAVRAQGTPPTAPAAPAAPTAPPASTAAKVATVNGVAIPKARVDMVVKSQAARGVPDSEQLRGEVKEQLIVREIVAQEASKKGLGKSADVQAQLELARQQVMWAAFVADFVKTNPVSDAQLKAEYERLRVSRGDKEYKTRHILVEKEDEAKAVIAELKKGRKFEELAKQSKDPGSKDKGGDLDWNSPAGYVKPFGDALTKLDKGKYTEVPVQTQFGWHVIMLEDVRPAKFPSFDEVKPQLTERLQEQAFSRSVTDLRAKAKVE
jgi:peptidyl-prolyl cis-trans isomerase C